MSSPSTTPSDCKPASSDKVVAWPASRLLRDFPTPPEVAEELEHICRARGLGPKERRREEDELKLSYYFGGKPVMITATPKGLMIHAADLPTSEEAHAMRVRLRTEGWQNVTSLYPERWEDLTGEHPTQLGILSADSPLS